MTINQLRVGNMSGCVCLNAKKSKMKIVAMFNFATKMNIAAVAANVGIKIAPHFAFTTNPICKGYTLKTINR